MHTQLHSTDDADATGRYANLPLFSATIDPLSRCFSSELPSPLHAGSQAGTPPVSVMPAAFRAASAPVAMAANASERESFATSMRFAEAYAISRCKGFHPRDNISLYSSLSLL